MVRQDTVGLTPTEELQLIREVFYLSGEDIRRRNTDRVVQPPTRWPPCIFLRWLGDGRQQNVLYHRVKFALLNGWLPEFVDHRDRDTTNHVGSNLRQASRSQNQANRVTKLSRWPRGVQPSRNGKRFFAKVVYQRQVYWLGTFDSPEEASAAVEAKLKELHGEFYRSQE